MTMHSKLRLFTRSNLVLPFALLGLAGCSETPEQEEAPSADAGPMALSPSASTRAEVVTAQPEVATDDARAADLAPASRQPERPSAVAGPARPAATESAAPDPAAATPDPHAGHDMTNHDMEGMHSQ